jgi:hypothetical protein
MNNFAKETNSISFPDAIAQTESLINQIEAGKLTEVEIEETVTNLVQTKAGARGFFVGYLTNNRSLADNPSSGVVNALKSSPEIVSELLVKNLAMSSAMAVTHRRNNDEEAVRGSERVGYRSAKLINLINLDLIRKELEELQITLATEQGSYQEFLERWDYDTEQKAIILKAIRNMALLS